MVLGSVDGGSGLLGHGPQLRRWPRHDDRLPRREGPVIGRMRLVPFLAEEDRQCKDTAAAELADRLPVQPAPFHDRDLLDRKRQLAVG